MLRQQNFFVADIMDALSLLLTRQSDPKLSEPGPTEQQLNVIKQAAMRAPDHGSLKPWRFISVQGDERQILGHIFAESARINGKDQAIIERAETLPLRAPLILITVAQPIKHAKVPDIEQIEATACATLMMQQAVFAQGLGAVWRTGDYAQCQHVKRSLGFKSSDEIVGFLYIGSASGRVVKSKRPDPSQYFSTLSKITEGVEE